MLNETYRAMLGNKSVIRETFMYGKQRAAEIGYENVFDYSLGNPSVPCPQEFTAAMQDLLANEEPVNLHGYCPSQGDPGFRTDVAAHLTKTFGLPYEQKHIFPTTGAAGAIAHAIRAVTQPGDEVLTFAPYFPEYGPYVAGTGAVLRWCRRRHRPSAQSGRIRADDRRKDHLCAHQHPQQPHRRGLLCRDAHPHGRDPDRKEQGVRPQYLPRQR